MRKLLVNLTAFALLTVYVGGCGHSCCNAADPPPPAKITTIAESGPGIILGTTPTTVTLKRVPCPCDHSQGQVCACGGNCICTNCTCQLAQAGRPRIIDAPAACPIRAIIVFQHCLNGVISCNGHALTSTGDTRTVTTPPFTGTSHYEVKATGFGKAITGNVTVDPGKTTIVAVDWYTERLTFREIEYTSPPVYAGYQPASGGCSGGCCGGSCRRR